MKRLRSPWMWAFALVGSAAAFACSSVSATQACTDLANAVCSKLAQCGMPLFNEVYGDQTTCASANETACTQAVTIKDTADTPDFTEKCSVAYGSVSCADFFENNPPKACTPTSPGKLGTGAVCGSGGECASNVCQLKLATGCGTCIEPVASGGACQGTSDCQAGLVCAATSATAAVCVTPAASGAACSTTAFPLMPCGYDLLCNSSNMCQAPLPAGSACSPAAPLCDTTNGYFCTPRGTRCILALYAGTGQPCGYDSMTGDYTLCSGSGACQNISQTTGLGTCTAPAATNAACDLVAGPFCAPPAICNVPGAGGDAGADAGTAGTCTVHDPSTCM